MPAEWAIAVIESIGTVRVPIAKAIPLAAAKPILIPVKLPGPTIAATASSSVKLQPASASTSSIIVITISACPWLIRNTLTANVLPDFATATEQAVV
ncbi:hypothetical protein A1OE_257 [Candidatus Endolissoclinum faulkneri L2]|uniref:Uncharacterized protein n=1 Tax=Candidatus Endolissoclinum faulkneri L2 TaxID=1193729 RepID=K7YLW0_9PROT|nr:hypothetical protein A1OE_257 [Candidatus Endolissoclinum faulkneri L2]